jgi:AGZA family xanthine/uracil permease-like MFS transporter
VVLGLGIDWRIALSAIFIEGLLFIALTLFNIRHLIVKAIPDYLKRATAAGIGLFIAYIALSGAGIIAADTVTKTKLGDLSQPSTLIAIAGILITSAFVARRLSGALLWGILATAVLAWILGVSPFPEGIMGVPELPVDLVGVAIAVWILAGIFVLRFIVMAMNSGT